MDTQDKHFLSEWLEKYPVFGLEMKLAWRRFKRGRVARYLVINEPDALPARLLKEFLIVCILSAIILIVICLFTFTDEVALAIQNSNTGYSLLFDWLCLLVWLFFVCVPAIQGSDCFNSSDDYAIFKQVACAGINGKRIASELLASAFIKSGIVFVALVLSFIHESILNNAKLNHAIYPLNGSHLHLPGMFFLVLMILQLLIFITSSTFGATRLGIINRRFAVLGFWIMTVAIPMVLGFWLIIVNNADLWNSNFELETNLVSFLATLFPLGSFIITYPTWFYGQSMFGESFSIYKDLPFALATVTLHLLYTYIAYRLACRLFARRLSE